MKKIRNLLLIFGAMALIGGSFTSCKDKDEPTPVIPTPTTKVADGFYLVGDATGSDTLNAKFGMSEGFNEAAKEVREGLYEKYVALEAGKEFYFILKDGEDKIRYGATLEEKQATGDGSPNVTLQKGSLQSGDNAPAMKVAKSGLYHIVLDLNEDKLLDLVGGQQVIVVPVEWGLKIAVNEKLNAPEFNKETMTYTLENVTIKNPGKFKFAYGDGWKIQLDDAGKVKVETNLGNKEKGLELQEKLVQGGEDIMIKRGTYTFSLTWTLSEGEVGKSYKATVTKTGDVAATYPDNLYMTGAALGNGEWNWETNAIELIPVHSNPHLFWSIQWLTIDKNAGFKFSPEKAWAGSDFGIDGDATDFVYAKGGNNVTVAEEGYYIIAVNLKSNKIEVNPACNVYGIGEAFGGWDATKAENMFTVDKENKLVVSPAMVAADKDVRMHVAASVLTNEEGNPIDWWQAEFIFLDGKIEYRGTGDDQARVPSVENQKVYLNFVDGTAEMK